MLLHQEFIKNAKKYGEKLAIIDRTTEKRVSYSKALIASLILANKFRKFRDGFIGIMIPTSAGCMLSVLGALLTGKVPVMINYSTGAANNAEYAQRKCGFKTIITSRALLEKIGCRLVTGMVFIEDIMEGLHVADKLKAALKAKLPLNLLLKAVHQGDGDDNVVILFTSGSEKDPKAVQLTHRNIGSNVLDIGKVLAVSSEDVMLANLPLFHVFGHNIDFWLPLYFGMTIVSYANPLEYKKVSSIVREEKVSLMVGTPSFFNGYLRQSDPGDFTSLRVAVAGADKTPDSLRAGFLEKHQLELCEGYGTTETSPVVATNLPGANKPGSVGKVLPSVRVKIVDINSGETLPPGSEGKILVKGDLVMKGYFDDLEETSLRIKDGWYETGDMGVLDEEGYLWHRGRLKRFVKIGGEMVSLVRVESVLLNLLPDGVDCCVVEVPDSLKGAKIVAALTQEVNERKILRALADELPSIALPKQFVVLDEFPKMGSGKIDFRTITEMVRQRLQP
ncbi:MAG: AMP-binding protein [Acidobacteria bacterium]|jgi:acyl-[acyl-carrier-protein]-phospholipid O-acyltransferase/long-chain-fatty-acid--[acyl-carrier-protein] ligase|nr:AMP-binding protein [Acidobacteriota bacterium]